jgi:hypothetical protein
MFREYLENNGFARLVRAAFEDGFLNDEVTARDEMFSSRAKTFANIAAKCAPEALQTCNVPDNSPRVEVEFVSDEPREQRFRKVSLQEILHEAWTSGRACRTSLLHRANETFDVWKNRIANISSFAKTESRRFAVIAANQYSYLTTIGQEGTVWMLMTGNEESLGTYAGPTLEKGDIVEYAFETACRVTDADCVVYSNVTARFPDCKFVNVERIGQGSILSASGNDLKVGDLSDFGIYPRGSLRVGLSGMITTDVPVSPIRGKAITTVAEKLDNDAVSCEVLDRPVGEVVESPKIVDGGQERPATDEEIKEIQRLLSQTAIDPNLVIVHGFPETLTSTTNTVTQNVEFVPSTTLDLKPKKKPAKPKSKPKPKKKKSSNRRK